MGPDDKIPASAGQASWQDHSQRVAGNTARPGQSGKAVEGAAGRFGAAADEALHGKRGQNQQGDADKGNRRPAPVDIERDAEEPQKRDPVAGKAREDIGPDRPHRRDISVIADKKCRARVELHVLG